MIQMVYGTRSDNEIMKKHTNVRKEKFVQRIDRYNAKKIAYNMRQNIKSEFTHDWSHVYVLYIWIGELLGSTVKGRNARHTFGAVHSLGVELFLFWCFFIGAAG